MPKFLKPALLALAANAASNESGNETTGIAQCGANYDAQTIQKCKVSLTVLIQCLIGFRIKQRRFMKRTAAAHRSAVRNGIHHYVLLVLPAKLPRQTNAHSLVLKTPNVRIVSTST